MALQECGLFQNITVHRTATCRKPQVKITFHRSKLTFRAFFGCLNSCYIFATPRFAILLVLLTLKNTLTISDSKQADCKVITSTGLSGPKSSRDFRKTGPRPWELRFPKSRSYPIFYALVIARSSPVQMLARSGVHRKNTDHGNGAGFSFLFAELCETLGFLWNKKLIEALIYAYVLDSATASVKPWNCVSMRHFLTSFELLGFSRELDLSRNVEI